jgi:hydroxymethylpyrimidine/phosphomethylpyrimidine kinase
VTGIHDVPADFITAQMDAVFSDLDVKAVKIGMVARREAIDAIVAGLDRWSPKHVVFDPVMVATSATGCCRPMPSMPCARALSACAPDHAEPAGSRRVAQREHRRERAGDRTAGQAFACSWCPAVLIKGGHGHGPESTDYLIDASTMIRLAAPRIATSNTHGTGCSLSSAVAAGLAKGFDLERAVREAKAYICCDCSGRPSEGRTRPWADPSFPRV